MVEPVGDASEFVVGFGQALQAYPDADVAVFLRKCHHAVRVITVGTHADPVALGLHDADNLFELFADEGFAPCDVQELQMWQTLVVLGIHLLVRRGRELPRIAHVTPGVAAVCCYQNAFHSLASLRNVLA